MERGLCQDASARAEVDQHKGEVYRRNDISLG